MHFNHGYSKDNEKRVVSGHLNKQTSLPGFDEYNHLYETPLNSTRILNTTPQEMKFVAGQMVPPKTGFKEMETGLGMFPNNAYSHLIHGDSFAKRTPPVFNEYSTIPYKNCRWEISADRLRIHRTIGRGEYGLVKMGLAFNVTKKGGWVPVAVKTLNDNGKLLQDRALCDVTFCSTSNIAIVKGRKKRQFSLHIPEFKLTYSRFCKTNILFQEKRTSSIENTCCLNSKL